MTVQASRLTIGDQFWVDPEPTEQDPEPTPVPVRLVAPGSWGLVHGVMDLPCWRLDELEHTTVSVHVNAVLRRVQPEELAQ